MQSKGMKIIQNLFWVVVILFSLIFFCYSLNEWIIAGTPFNYHDRAYIWGIIIPPMMFFYGLSNLKFR